MSANAQCTSCTRWPVEPEQLPRILEHFEELAGQWELPPKTTGHLNLIIEELVVNVLHYAKAPAGSSLEICLERTLEGINGTLRDRGTPFNPLDKADPDMDQGVEKRALGGLGVYFVKQLTSAMSYQRCDESNILSFSLRFPLGNRNS